MSNQFLDAAYKRISSSTFGSNRDDNTVKPDYSWATEQYPRPCQHDLAAQVDSFLSSSLPRRAATESLWVFNVGVLGYLVPRSSTTQTCDWGTWFKHSGSILSSWKIISGDSRPRISYIPRVLFRPRVPLPLWKQDLELMKSRVHPSVYSSHACSTFHLPLDSVTLAQVRRNRTLPPVNCEMQRS